MNRFVIGAACLLAPGAALAQDTLTVRLQQAIQRHERGERVEAAREFNRFIDVYNGGASSLTSQQLVAVARAVTYLGAEDPQLFKDALRAYDRAIAADPDNLDARVRLAELFLDKYNGADAKRTLAEVLSRNANYVPALVAEARRRDFDNERGADSVLGRALTLEPENVPARVLRSAFRADVEDFASARTEADRALRADPNDPAALAQAMALAEVMGDTTARVAFGRRYAARLPRDAGAHVAVAELLARVRQYAAAAKWARSGTQTDARDWKAHSVLGLNLLRLGDVDAGKKSLEVAFKGDPYNVWVKNTLDLLDTFDEYDVVTRGRFRFMIDTVESGVLSLYLGELADRAYTTFAARYGFTPTSPIRMEVYRSHADFSVRTVGLAGLGALGVSFGNTVAFDSPAAKDAGMFNWASTAWHELAHTFTLGASDQRVPRWLSEGLSVLEERKGRPGWGQNVSPAFLKAYSDGKLTLASRLNDGFVRPSFPGMVQFSYYAASLVCEMIARDFGDRALMEMLAAYRRGLGTEQVFRTVLKTDLPSFDRKYDAYLRERFGAAMQAVKSGSYERQLGGAREALLRGDTAASITLLERARAALPDYGGADSPYPMLARLLLARGDKRRAGEVLSAMVKLGDVPYQTHVNLADLLLQNGDTAAAANALESAMFMNPYEIAQHERLALLYTRLGNKQKAVRERKAVVALKPVDRAEAYYHLAIAQRDAGESADARRSVLRALEDAPHFERAQELLLQLRGGRP